MICLEHISRVYSSKKGVVEDVYALDDVSLTLPEVGFISICGASGSGKTTLLNILGGLDTPTSGRMVVDEISTENFTSKDWDAYRNEKVGFVLQNCYLLPHLSIGDNVAIKLQISNKKYQNVNELVDSSLEAVDMLSRKYDRPKTLSGGQKQRVAIARAIVGKPTLILADEPTGALDSKNGKQIMELLKKLSKDHLVVMVTHNKEYADKYSDRIIELSDGKIIKDSVPINSEVIVSDKKVGKVAFPFFTSLIWGIKNLVLRIGSTLSVIIATSLGLAGVGLILSISTGVEATFAQTETKALSQYPVSIRSNSKYTPEGTTPSYTPFPTEEVVFADLGSFSIRDHRNYMSSRFLTYMGELDSSVYTNKYETSSLRINTITRIEDSSSYKLVTSPDTRFYKGLDIETFTKHNYDCLYGSYPSSKYDLAIVIDKYNRVDASTLNWLGFNIDTSYQHEVKIDFADVINKTYKYVSNNQIYVYNSGTNLYDYINPSSPSAQQAIYDNAPASLNIVGILREKVNSDNPALNSGIIFSEDFAKYAVQESNSSNVVTAQKAEGLARNVRTGAPITETKSGNVTYSADYNYESILYNFGAVEEISNLQYFTNSFEGRNTIKNYFNSYTADETEDFTTLSYRDDLEHISFQFDGALSLMTSVLYAFAFVSVFVSMVLNAILTYISVHQRTSEIGLLRSLGARKVDVGIMIETESIISGLLGSLLSVLFCVISIAPINIMLTDAIYRYKFYLLSQTTFTLPGFQMWVAPVLIGIGILTSAISAIIPAVIAAKKDPAHAINE